VDFVLVKVDRAKFGPNKLGAAQLRSNRRYAVTGMDFAGTDFGQHGRKQRTILSANERDVHFIWQQEQHELGGSSDGRETAP